MLDGMHLVEATRALAAFTEQSETNASHPGCLRVLCRIVLAILLNNEEQGKIRIYHTTTIPLMNRVLVLRKPFISLSRMILWPEIHTIGDVEPGIPSFPFNNESKLELRAAQAAVEAVLAYNSIDSRRLKPKDLKHFEWLAREEAGDDWRDPGTSILLVPDVRSYFRAFDGTNLSQPGSSDAAST